MLPDLEMCRRAFDPAMLALDAEKWLTAFSWNGRKQYPGVEATPKPNGQSLTILERLASNTHKTPPPSHSPASSSSFSPASGSPPSSFSSSFSSFSTFAPSSSSPYFSNEYLAIQPSPKGGLGAFAIRDIPIGMTVIVEKPLIKVYSFEEVPWRYDELSREKKQEYDSLHHWVGIDSDRVYGIFKTNRFELRESKTGIFAICSRFNHACHPHTTCTYTWDMKQERMKISTLRDIMAGEELTISYMGWSVDRNLLQQNYGFQCDCPGCMEDRAREEEAKKLAGVTPPLRVATDSESDGVLYISGGV